MHLRPYLNQSERQTCARTRIDKSLKLANYKLKRVGNILPPNVLPPTILSPTDLSPNTLSPKSNVLPPPMTANY